MERKAYLQFGRATFGEPCQTVEVPLKETAAPRSGQTVTGYGSRIPTGYMIQWEGRWRRVYAACWGNSASHYIGPAGDWLATVTIN